MLRGEGKSVECNLFNFHSVMTRMETDAAVLAGVGAFDAS
jgi:hypothetical protein